MKRIILKIDIILNNRSKKIKKKGKLKNENNNTSGIKK